VIKPLKVRVAECRRLHQNPYALIEYLDEFDEAKQGPLELSDADGARLSASRKALEDPYAYLDGEGGFSAVDADEIAASLVSNDHGPRDSDKADRSTTSSAVIVRRRLKRKPRHCSGGFGESATSYGKGYLRPIL